MDGKHHLNNKENNSPAVNKEKRLSNVCTQCNGQLSFGRRILATKKDLQMRRIFSSTTRGKQIMGRHNCEVSLKDSNGLLVGKGILLSKIQIGDDVGGFILFPHQVVVRIVEVYPCGKQKQNEDGQVLRKCIGQIVR